MTSFKKVLRKLPAVHRLQHQHRNAQHQKRQKAECEAIRSVRRNPSGCARVLITGDLGRLGGIVAEALKSDYDIVGFDAKYGPEENLKNIDSLRSRIEGCDYVLHAAGIPHPKKGRMEAYFEANVLGTLNVLRSAAEAKIKRLIYFSSVGYYGCNIEGKLLPAYFPIDEDHPPASSHGRSQGKLDEYNQSKVMAEELVAYFGTNEDFETIALRLAPANSKAKQYPANNDEWRSNPRYRRGAFWTNCHPDYVAKAVQAALQAPGPFRFEAFNITDKYAPKCVDIDRFLAEEYPDTPIRWDKIDEHYPSLISVEKAERMLGFKPCEDLE